MSRPLSFIFLLSLFHLSLFLHPGSTARAQKLTSDIPYVENGRVNDDLGKPDDPATRKLYEFLDARLDAG